MRCACARTNLEHLRDRDDDDDDDDDDDGDVEYVRCIYCLVLVRRTLHDASFLRKSKRITGQYLAADRNTKWPLL